MKILVFFISLFCLTTQSVAEEDYGIRFVCDKKKLDVISKDLNNYIESLSIDKDSIVLKSSEGKIQVYLKERDVSAMSLGKEKKFSITNDIIDLPVSSSETKKVSVVSKKEIFLALLSYGRLTTFSNEQCDAAYLYDEIGIRQNIVAWTSQLNWNWPDGDYAFWNSELWDRGTPKKDRVIEAFNDMFFHSEKYGIGCYAAAKIVMIQGVLDYYHRIKGDFKISQKIIDSLFFNGEPLNNVEPDTVWSFEPDYDPQDASQHGKIVAQVENVQQSNIIPGDWVYILNTDAETYRKVGYEGSNAIYLGDNVFSDYYNDNDHGYSFDEKLNEVFQWRNGVFSRSSDADKIVPLTEDELRKLRNPPNQGGLLMTFRLVPQVFLVN